jgi:cell division protein FtsA
MSLEFSLDVGTRKVCGILAEAGPEGRPARILHWAVREHPGRAMLDGQVHIIAQAAQVIAEVKEELERACGQALRHAHVAVAGRSLSTGRAKLSFKTGHGEPLGREELAAMELQTVREARSALRDARSLAGAYCVGFSVLSARLDNEVLADLRGHRGAEVELEVLATFLPKLALESLQTALAGAGLTAASLTLEPIAAVQLMVPPEMRRLNLGLVDVGAGTSDVALTREGRVDAFAMVPVAGDEVTERVADAFLLDFKQAEALKRAVGGTEGATEAEAVDIFGARRLISCDDVQREIQPARNYWAEETAAALLALNGGKAPQAVLLAGGGSLLKGASFALAAALDMDHERVGHRPMALQSAFEALPQGLDHPWAVTPLGIAASALGKRGLPFANFQVNGKWVQVLNLNQRFTAFDALVASGKERVQFFGKPGLATVYTFNGEERTAKGTLGNACRLFINGAPAGLEAPLESGASLTFVGASNGEDGKLTFAEALEREGLSSGSCLVNGEERPLPLELSVDGFPVEDLKAAVPDRARLTIKGAVTLKGLLEREGVDLGGLIHREIAVSLDGEPRVLLQRNYRLKLNGKEASLDREVMPGDRVDFEPGSGFQERVRDLLAAGSPPSPAPDGGAFRVRLNGDWAPLDRVEIAWMNGREVSLDEFLIDGADVRVRRGPACRTVKEAMERLGLSSWVGDGLEIRLNGARAGLDDALADGDALDLSLLEPVE